MREQITALRREMKKRGVFAYVVMTEDFHGSEYVGAHFKLREYLSGFTGSAGTLVVTENKAALWTDGRYFIQAASQLSGSGIDLMRQGEPETLSIADFLKKEMPEGSALGFDGRAVRAAFALNLRRALCEKNIAFKTDEDLGDLAWSDRPAMSKVPVFALPISACGLSRAEKLAKIREKMRSEKAGCLALAELSDIAWALNLRGGDVDYNPVFLSFMLVFEDKVLLFAERSIFGDDIARSLKDDGVELLPYSDIYSALSALNCAVWCDPKAVNFRFWSALRNARKIAKTTPVELMKACKNASEAAAERNAHIKDGVAVTRFMMWLKSAVQSELITEISAAEKLEEFRKTDADYLGQSFEPIMAYGAHGAIVHYSATEDTNAVLEPCGLLLSDTGGHYLDGGNTMLPQGRQKRCTDAAPQSALGTTDITRTFVLGELSDEEKRAFTLVLAAHLELLGAVFPRGVRGSTLDGIARKPLWDNGLDFKHGTGHGVGFLLNVHEGPQRISCRTANDVPLSEGMITSDEPGLYFEEKFGIRHESLVLCEKSDFDGFLKFSPLTCVPFDRDGIDKSLLTNAQISRLNEYHKWVCETLSPLLSEEEREWLGEVTKPI